MSESASALAAGPPKPGDTQADLDWYVADEGECALGCSSARAGESGEYVLEVGHAK